MEVIDAQVHVAAKDSRPKSVAGTSDTQPTSLDVTIEEMLDAMAAARVDAAIVATQSLRAGGNEYELRAAAEHPTRFAAVGTIDPGRADLDDAVSPWRSQPAMLGIRVVLLTQTQID
jgi:predicted TIM-barrel fold metal-dependent hydrolase